jgi:lysophospholipase L1-like esterase
VASLHIVSLGDSLAYGAGDESGGGGIAGRLDRDLHARGIEDAYIVNLGVNGAQTTDLVARLEQQRVRDLIAKADAIVLSIGANDLFRSQHSREEVLRNPLAIAQRILKRIHAIVTRLHEINARARVLLLGAYNPVPQHDWSTLINQYISMWDQTLAQQFANDERVSVVRMADLVTPQRLSRYDSFHPGAKAYDAVAKRIADMLVSRAA